MKTSARLSSPVLCSALLGGLFIGLFGQGCSPGGGSQPVGSGRAPSVGGTTGSGGSTGKTSGTGGAGTGGAGSGGVGAGGASAGGSGAATGGRTGAAGSGVGAGGTGTGGGAGTGGSSAIGGGSGGTGVGGSAGRGGAGGGSLGAGAGGSAGAGGAGAGGRGGSAGAGGAGAVGSSAFNPCPADGTPCAIMPLGDSITDGVGASAPGGGYRVELFHKAVQAGKAITFVGSATDPNGPTTLDGKPFPRNHEGHPGYTIDTSGTNSGIAPLVDASIATNHPHIVLLMIGTNDINRNIDPANAPTRLGALLDGSRTVSRRPT
jgi:hypothetical protein